MLLESVQKALEDNDLVAGSDELIAGVSGGVDSMVMMALLHHFGYATTIVHINYHTRGKASDLDEKLVRKIAETYGFDICVRHVTPEQAEGNFQEWARDIRYSVYRECLNQKGASAIAVAHNRDDQVETVLFKILHGAGPDSWQGMQSYDGEIVRPLLDISRSEIEAYAKENNIHYREDETNRTSAYARNLIRNEWVPRLDLLVPGWRENLLEIPELSAAYKEAAGRILEQLLQPEGGLSRTGLLAIGPGLQKSIIAEYIRTFTGRDGGFSRQSLHQLDHLEKLQTGKKIRMSGEISLMRDRDRFVLKSGEKETSPSNTIEFKDIEKGPIDHGKIRLRLQEIDRFKPEANKLMLDGAKIKWPLIVRPWVQGDRFQPIGMTGHQKISDHLANRKIDASRKKEAQLVVSFDGTICAVIFPSFSGEEPGTLSEKVKCDASTRKVVIVEQIKD